MDTLRRDVAVQKLSTLRTHDASTFCDEVFLNIDRFPELNAKPGDLIRIVAILEDSSSKETGKRDSGTRSIKGSSESNAAVSQESTQIWTTYRGLPMTILTIDENGRKISSPKTLDHDRTYVFRLQETTPDQQKQFESISLSMASNIASIFGFKNRAQVLVSIADEETHAASHVEITFRDQYLSRADMWRLVISELSQKTVYRDQKLTFLDSIKATVKNVYQNGEKKRSGYFGKSTRPVFRSESARYIIFIQMSREMWEFDVDGGGEINFNKVINGFLPELFKTWTAISARHLISIVLFSRVEYDENDPKQPSVFEREDEGPRAGTRDFYRVVVSDVSSGDWISILHQLKREFKSFLRDITIQRSAIVSHGNGAASKAPEEDSGYVIVGRPSSATKGNILEALNLASSHFSRDYIDRDLVRTGISVVVVTAGSGVYEVDYSLLKLTTEILIGSGIGIDLVCLAPMPLHSVPLFKYRNPRMVRPEGGSDYHSRMSLENTPRQGDMISARSFPSLERTSTGGTEPVPGDWSFAIPHWIDVSFWKGSTDELASSLAHLELKTVKHKNQTMLERPFAIRCVLYELEMMGFMENEMINIAVPLIHEHALHPWHKLRYRITGRPAAELDRSGIAKLEREWMDDHDDDVFKPARRRKMNEDAARKLFKQGLAERDLLKSGANQGQAPISENAKNDMSSSHSPELKTTSGQLPVRILSRRAPSIMSSTSTVGRINVSSSDRALTTAKMLERQLSNYRTSGSKGEVDSDTFSVNALASLSHEHKTPQTALGYLSQFKSLLTRSTVKSPSKAVANRNLPHNTIASSSSSSLEEESVPVDSLDAESLTRRSRPIAIAAGRIVHKRTASGEVGSIETIKGVPKPLKKASLPRSMKGEDASAILYVASNTRRQAPKHGLSSSGEAPRLLQTLSPYRSNTPWLVLVNPSNPKKNNWNINNQFRRWKHVFPKQLKTSSMKWKSLSSPASVPLTNDFFPTGQQLVDEYSQHPYNISQNMDMDLSEEPKSSEALVRELIAFRLAHGFQLIVGAAISEYLGNQGSELANIFDKDYMAKDGATVFMSLGSSIHQLLCLPNEEVEIRIFHRKPASEVETPDGDILRYQPYIRTPLSKSYVPRSLNFSKPTGAHNWNFIDNFLAGHDDDFSDQLRFWRARFVFIPIDVTPSNHKTLALVSEDSEEEIRLEGIRKLTVLWQKHRVVEEQGFQSMRRRKDKNPLMIDYQTKDPSAVVAAGPEGLLMTENNPNVLIFSDTERYHTTNIDLQKLAQDIQGEQGIRMLDRRWHWKLYMNCFLGSDLTSWMLERFGDINTREDAVEFGNELMTKGLFQHVSKRHPFRDGNFFFHIASDYRVPRGDAKGWFSRRERGSVPSTPLADSSRAISSPDIDSRPVTSHSTQALDEKHPAPDQSHRRKVTLSQVMKLNVDTKKLSYRPEIINLHYGRLHSPDNCYHFRIDWMNVTSKFIEDSISQWALHGRKYGLRLVEAPIAEASSISDSHPFRSCYKIQLALPPPQDNSRHTYSASGFSTKENTDKHSIHKNLLKKLGFVLDIESSDSFPTDVDVQYSWGRNEYRYTQFIHKSGTTLAQITNEGDFLLLANRLYNDRTLTTREPAKIDLDVKALHDRRHPRIPSPTSSPSLRPVVDGQLETERNAKSTTAEDIKDDVEAFCHNTRALQAFYDELRKPIPSPSPHMGITLLDQPIPSLRLPPRVLSLKESNSTSSSPTSPNM